ncbi:MAG: hypothetical protein ACE5EU_08120 [Paracoccaceae bacterium]
MTNQTNSRPAEPGFWARTWRGLRAFDESLHHDPAEALQSRIERLEARLREVESVS